MRLEERVESGFSRGEVAALKRGDCIVKEVRAGCAQGEEPVPDEPEAVIEGALAYVGKTPCPLAMASVEDNGRLYRFRAFYTIREYQDWAARHPDLAPKD